MRPGGLLGPIPALLYTHLAYLPRLCLYETGKFSGVDRKTSNGMETRSSQTLRSIARV